MYFLLQVPHRDFSANETHSVLRYKPESDNDFGYLYCWAENILGKMETPCAFQLIPAGKFQKTLWISFWIECCKKITLTFCFNPKGCKSQISYHVSQVVCECSRKDFWYLDSLSLLGFTLIPIIIIVHMSLSGKS